MRHAKPGGDMVIRDLVKKGIFTFGGEGNKGVGKAGLVLAIRTYRLVPQRARVLINRHPMQGSSWWALQLAKRGYGRDGVAEALTHCGCMSAA